MGKTVVLFKSVLFLATLFLATNDLLPISFCGSGDMAIARCRV
jgi:hypothetical protein